MTAMQSSQTDNPPALGAVVTLLLYRVWLTIDMRGTSDILLGGLVEIGDCCLARVLLFLIKKMADAVDPINPRSLSISGQSHVRGWSVDNTDDHLFHRCVSIVPVGYVLLGVGSEDNSAYFNENYMEGLGKLLELKTKDLATTKYEDKTAQDVIDNQNVIDPLTASVDFKLISARTASIHTSSSARPNTGSKVTCSYRSNEREDTVKLMSTRDAAVEFSNTGHPVTTSIPLKDITGVQVHVHQKIARLTREVATLTIILLHSMEKCKCFNQLSQPFQVYLPGQSLRTMRQHTKSSNKSYQSMDKISSTRPCTSLLLSKSLCQQ